MAENTPITVYTAECIGNAANCLYPNEVKITDELSAKLAFSTDMVCARYKNNYRNTANFEVANALPGDCDNDHSEIAADWVTPEDIADLFADVPYVLHYSRHHMKPKGEKSARPRFHIVFLIDPERDADRYTALKRSLLAAFPFFDANAMDAARFLFGTEDPQVIYHPGTITLNAFLDDLENKQAFANMGHTIPEGSRNSTMSRIGARIIKRYGDTPEAKELFLQAAGQCSPPLEDRELESIWAGKQRLYAKMCNQPGYIPPDAYNSTGPVVWDTPIPFDEYDLPTFPVDALPEVIRRYVLAVAESTQTSVDMAAVEALGVVSLCSQGKYFIRGNADWAEPLNTYTVVILPPAERKSSVLSMMIRPVEVFEKLENERRSPEIVKSQMELSKLEKEKRSLVERASKGKATEADIKNKAKEIAEYEPVKPLRLFVDDVTSEKLTSVLAENNGCAAVVSAEGGIFDIISGLYSRNVNIDVFLKGHSGDTIRVDRIGRASESIIHPALTMVLAVQPEVLNGLMSNNTFRGRGLTARFLYSMPKSTVGSRSFSTEPIPEGVRVRYQDLIEAILSSDNEQQPISLDDGAEEVLETLFNEVEGRLKGDLAEIPDWAGKFVGSVLRISGILHVMKYPKDSMFDSVDRETIFDDYLAGKGVTAIAKRLNESGYATQSGCVFHKSAVERILRNYAYTGNLLLQTKFRENHLTKVTRKNQGELPRYHATDTHEAIIPPETFNAVQAEIRRRKEKYAPTKPPQTSPFTGLITCAICGKHYRRKTTATGPVWICSTYNSYGKSYCPSKAIPEEKLMQTAALVGHTGEITAITAYNDNLLEFTLKDGTSAVKRWQDRSRAESWTAEMRRAAGEKTRERKQCHVES